MKIIDKRKNNQYRCISECLVGTIVELEGFDGFFMVLDTKDICSVFGTAFNEDDDIFIVNCGNGDTETIRPNWRCRPVEAKMCIE